MFGEFKPGSRSTMESPSDNRYAHTLSLIAHELRSPASIVRGYLRMLLDRGGENLTAQQRHMIEEAGGACGRLLALIQELGELASLEEHPTVRSSIGVPVFSICGEVVASNTSEESGSRPPFICAEEDLSATVNGDAGSLKRAFMSLMAATAREHGSDRLECCGFITQVAGVPQAVVVVGAPGVGARRDELLSNRVPYDRWRGGTGLSLPIACRIIEAHGGCVWAPAVTEWRRASGWNLPIPKSLAQSA